MQRKVIYSAVIVVCLAALVYLSVTGGGIDRPPPLPVGGSGMPSGHPGANPEKTMAPDFTLPSLDGKEFTLSSLRGKVVMLNFWSTSCPPCIMEMPSMQRLYEKMRGKPFEILAVTSDTPAAAGRTIQSRGVTFPVLIDRDLAAARAYQVYSTPLTFIIAADGTVDLAAPGAYNWDDETVINYLDSLISGEEPEGEGAP